MTAQQVIERILQGLLTAYKNETVETFIQCAIDGLSECQTSTAQEATETIALVDMLERYSFLTLADGGNDTYELVSQRRDNLLARK